MSVSNTQKPLLLPPQTQTTRRTKAPELLLPSVYMGTGDVQHYVWTPELRQGLHQALTSELGHALKMGGALLMLPPGSQERFTTFVPLLRRGEDNGEYIVDDPDKGKTFWLPEWNDIAAVDIAISWMCYKRRQEIEEWLDCIKPGNIPTGYRLGILNHGFLYKSDKACYYLNTETFNRFQALLNTAILPSKNNNRANL